MTEEERKDMMVEGEYKGPQPEQVEELGKMTKAELVARIQLQEEEMKQVSETLDERTAELLAVRGIAAGVGGWLVTTPNAEYSGVTAGLRFGGGKAFLPENKENAEFLSIRLANDFGYEVIQLTAEEVGKMRVEGGDLDDAVNENIAQVITGAPTPLN